MGEWRLSVRKCSCVRLPNIYTIQCLNQLFLELVDISSMPLEVFNDTFPVLDIRKIGNIIAYLITVYGYGEFGLQLQT